MGTIMAKVGRSEAYAGTALPAATFMLKPAIRPEDVATAAAIPSQAQADGVVALSDHACLDSGRVLAEIPNGETCILWRDAESASVEVQYGEGLAAIRGFAAANQFKNRTYRLLLNLRLSEDFRIVYEKALDAVATKFGSSTVQRAYKDGRTYPHFTLAYDFEVNKEQLLQLVSLLRDFCSNNMRIPLRMKGAGSFGTSVIFLDVDRTHERYGEAMALHLKLLQALKALDWLPETNVDRIHWHATVCYKDFDKDLKDELQDYVAKLGEAATHCCFDNVTIMAKVGRSEAYAGTALPAATFMLRSASRPEDVAKAAAISCNCH